MISIAIGILMIIICLCVCILTVYEIYEDLKNDNPLLRICSIIMLVAGFLIIALIIAAIFFP